MRKITEVFIRKICSVLLKALLYKGFKGSRFLFRVFGGVFF